MSSFAVLFVCTGNICRSPVGEKLFRSRLPSATDVSVSSAGTHGLPGWGIDAQSALALRELGVDPDGHSARLLDQQIAQAADLVLTATAEHRRAVQVWAPSQLVFTMREFARLAATVGVDAVELPPERVARLAQARLTAPSVRRGADNIADPYGGGLTAARTAVAEISLVVDAALAALGLSYYES